jgi:hypothetical protein
VSPGGESVDLFSLKRPSFRQNINLFSMNQPSFRKNINLFSMKQPSFRQNSPGGESVVAIVCPSDGATLENHVVLCQGSSLITE